MGVWGERDVVGLHDPRRPTAAEWRRAADGAYRDEAEHAWRRLRGHVAGGTGAEILDVDILYKRGIIQNNTIAELLVLCIIRICIIVLLYYFYYVLIYLINPASNEPLNKCWPLKIAGGS